MALSAPFALTFTIERTYSPMGVTCVNHLTGRQLQTNANIRTSSSLSSLAINWMSSSAVEWWTFIGHENFKRGMDGELLGKIKSIFGGVFPIWPRPASSWNTLAESLRDPNGQDDDPRPPAAQGTKSQCPSQEANKAKSDQQSLKSATVAGGAHRYQAFRNSSGNLAMLLVRFWRRWSQHCLAGRIISKNTNGGSVCD